MSRPRVGHRTDHGLDLARVSPRTPLGLTTFAAWCRLDLQPHESPRRVNRPTYNRLIGTGRSRGASSSTPLRGCVHIRSPSANGKGC
jgi:hypothetical protein